MLGMQCRYISLSTAQHQVWSSQPVWGSSIPKDTTKAPLRICFEISCFVLCASVANSAKSPRAAEGAETSNTSSLCWCTICSDVWSQWCKARSWAKAILWVLFGLCLYWVCIRCTGHALEDSMNLRSCLYALWGQICTPRLCLWHQ